MFGDMDVGEALRLAAYATAAVACVFAWRIEKQFANSQGRDLYPPFWIMATLVVAALGLAAVVGIGGTLTDLGRDRAHTGGWYENRRMYQAILVLLLGGAWLAVTGTAILRTPERRRRYLPAFLLVVFLAFYGVIRVVSLHHVDSVLYRTDFAGIGVSKWIDFVACALVVVACYAAARRLPATLATHRRTAAPEPR